MKEGLRKGLRVAVVGATGAVGKALLSILDERKFPIQELSLFSSSRSAGKEIIWQGKSHSCQILQEGCFKGIDIAFFDASDAVSRKWVPEAAESGTWVIDNSSTFRLDDDILLGVPEVNGDVLEKRLIQSTQQSLTWRERVVAGPNCAAAPLAVALKPIQDLWGIKRIVLSTYQSTSGAGAAAVEELSTQALGILTQKPVPPKVFSHQIAFNCIPHIGGFTEDGSTSEEQKIIAETQKLLGKPDLRVSATAVRVPTFSCHAESVNIECERPFSLEEVRNILQRQSGIIVQDEPGNHIYPLGFTFEGDQVESATGRDAIYVGRIRRDASVENGLNLWIVSDNLRKGAALNAVQLGEILLKVLY